MQDVSNPIALDNRENEIIIATNAGDLCFIVPGKWLKLQTKYFYIQNVLKLFM